MDIVIAIPSYGRVDILKQRTAKLLKDIFPNNIYIFVVEDEYSQYKDAFPMYNVIKGRKGLAAQRNFIQEFFPPGQKIVSMDDDIQDLKRIDKSSASLPELIQEGFSQADKVKSKIWGVYPVLNYGWMKDTVTTDLTFLIGCFFGYYNPGKEITPTISEKDDYERVCLFWLRDKVLVRLNNVAVKTTIYKTPGGLQQPDRLEKQHIAVKFLTETYPTLLAPKKRGKYPELRFLKQNRCSLKPTTPSSSCPS